MENIALILIAITLLILVIVLGLLTMLVYRLLHNNKYPPENPHSEFHPGIVDRMKELKKVTPKKSNLLCPNHPEEPGEVTCAICDRLYCRACIKPYKTLHFCKEHLPLIMTHEWNEVLTLRTSTTDPEQGVALYDAKKLLFDKEDIPTFIETHYKINVDQDYIETYLVLFALSDRVDDLRERFRDFSK